MYDIRPNSVVEYVVMALRFVFARMGDGSYAVEYPAGAHREHSGGQNKVKTGITRYRKGCPQFS